jgi:hypothetical protein
MIEFDVGRRGIILEYEAELGGNGWVWREIKKRRGLRLSYVFWFERQDLFAEPGTEDQENFEDFTFRFRLATTIPGYYSIAGRKLGIKNEVLISKSGVNWSRKLFAAERNISVFGRISKLVGPDDQIVIGGEKKGAIPLEVFTEMLKKFPSSRELDLYTNARVATTIGDYLDPRRDFRAQYDSYLDRRKSARRDQPLRAEELLTTEIEKFQLVRDTIAAWLASGERSEEQWQKQLLAFLPIIFPKYIAVIEKVPIEDRYSKPGKVVHRQIDLALVDVNGNIDVIEIKKPMDDVLLRKTPYRDNFVPTGDLSGAIMQAEKYLFHLGKGGVAAEDKLTEKFAAVLPPEIRIRITNPKALLILGRDRKIDGSAALTPLQLFDLEVIKRKYANMIDIITYDDLLRRLDNIIASLQLRKKRGLDAAMPPKP